MNTARGYVALVRDVLAIVIMVVLLWVGWNVVQAAHDIEERGTVQRPAVEAPLPKDVCGGGIC
jgi:TRAP-type C4-dicarboxylate transport system permease small subunit